MKTSKKPAIIRGLTAYLGLLGVLLLMQAPAQGEIYKWYDKDNQLQYTQTPPPAGVRSEQVSVALPPLSAEGKGPASLEARMAASEERNQKQAEEAEMAEKKAELSRIMEENCSKARKNLVELNRTGQIRYRSPDGTVFRLSDEERQQRIDQTNSQIEEFCKG